MGYRKRKRKEPAVPKAPPSPSKMRQRKEYSLTQLSSDIFSNYYAANEIVPAEETEAFYAALRTKLPSVFRVCSTPKAVSDSITDLVENTYFPMLRQVEESTSLHALPWIPNAYHVSLSRSAIRRSPEYEKFHDFLKAETQVGHIFRQEQVSMVPPSLLDVKGHHRVLDMCAAPGSKTIQLLEAMHQQNDAPTGMVVANDADHKRAYMLVHQTKKCLSPCLVVTNHDATRFPLIRDKETNEPLLFDRVLCDVPCSGDGTLRKNMILWRRWTPAIGNGLFPLQCRLLERAVRLTKVGGRIVYSTCSFNPIENEAVICTILEMFGDSVSLVDVSDSLLNLKRRPGIKTWKVMNKKGELVTPEDEGFTGEMFARDNCEFPLERCMRLVPHDQDSGGFFVAVLEKTGTVSRREEADENIDEVVEDDGKNAQENEEIKELNEEIQFENEESEENQEESQQETEEQNDSINQDSLFQSSTPSKGFKEDPFIFCSDDLLNPISSFYGLELDPSLFLVRTLKQPRTIYHVTSSIRQFLTSAKPNQLCVVNTGLKAFSFHLGRIEEDMEGRCQYRLQQEAIHSFKPANRTIELSVKDALIILKNEKARFYELDSFTFNDLPVGCVLVRTGFVEFTAWKGKNTIQTMVIKNERASFIMALERLKE